MCLKATGTKERLDPGKNGSEEGPRGSCRVRDVAPGREAWLPPPLPQLGLHLFTSGLPQRPWKAVKYSLKTDCF